MARHTIGDKRGSVRGAPPDMYIPFGSLGDDDDPAPWEDVFDLAKAGLTAAGLFLLLVFLLVCWCAITGPDYSNQ